MKKKYHGLNDTHATKYDMCTFLLRATVLVSSSTHPVRPIFLSSSELGTSSEEPLKVRLPRLLAMSVIL